MIKELEKFVATIKAKGVDNKGSIYAQMLKNERVKRKLTLEEVAEGICSVSYLCKLENYAIKSCQPYIRDLFDKMDLNYDEVEGYDPGNLLTEAIKAYFHNNDDKIDELFDKASKLPFCSYVEIVKGIYYLDKSMLNEFLNTINVLDNIKYTLGGLESICFIYLVTQYKIITYHFKEALHYLKNLELLDISNKFLHYLILEANLVVSMYLNNSCRLFHVYSEYEKISYVGYPIGRRIESKMIYNLFKVNEYPLEVLEDVLLIDLDAIPCENKMSVLFYQILIRMKNGDLKKIFNEIVEGSFYIDSRFLGLLGYIAYKLNDTNCYKKLLDIVEDYSFTDLDAPHQKFVCFILLYASDQDVNQLLMYMREYVNPYLSVEIIPLYNEVYKEIFLSFLIKNSKYKESYYFLASTLKNN